MALPFEPTESTTRGLGVLRGRGSVTLSAIENLLAKAPAVRDVTPAMVTSLCEERRVDLPNRLARGRRQLYARYLKHCFEDRRLSDDERADLAHLRALLHLSPDELADIQDEVAIEDFHAELHRRGVRIRMFQPEAMDMETVFMKLTEGKTA